MRLATIMFMLTKICQKTNVMQLFFLLCFIINAIVAKLLCDALSFLKNTLKYGLIITLTCGMFSCVPQRKLEEEKAKMNPKLKNKNESKEVK